MTVHRDPLRIGWFCLSVLLWAGSLVYAQEQDCPSGSPEKTFKVATEEGGEKEITLFFGTERVFASVQDGSTLSNLASLCCDKTESEVFGMSTDDVKREKCWPLADASHLRDSLLADLVKSRYGEDSLAAELHQMLNDPTDRRLSPELEQRGWLGLELWWPGVALVLLVLGLQLALWRSLSRSSAQVHSELEQVSDRQARPAWLEAFRSDLKSEWSGMLAEGLVLLRDELTRNRVRPAEPGPVAQGPGPSPAGLPFREPSPPPGERFYVNLRDPAKRTFAPADPRAAVFVIETSDGTTGKLLPNRDRGDFQKEWVSWFPLSRSNWRDSAVAGRPVRRKGSEWAEY